MMSKSVERAALNLQKAQGFPGWVACWNESDRDPASAFQIIYSDETRIPALAANHSCAVVFEGFLQNRKELIPLLDETGSANLNDSEILLRCYQKMGEDFLQKIKGVFLMSVWDKKKNSVLIVRDRCGIFPAFFTYKGGKVYFSDSAANLVRHPEISTNINRSAFVDYLSHRRPVPEETFYKDVKRVLPGHAIRFAGGSDHSLRYWYCFPPDGDVEYISEISDNGFDEALDQAVARCLELGPTSIFLSGGLDSVSVASVASDLARRNGKPAPLALSIGFAHPQCNEIERQLAVAKGLGLEIVLFPIEELIPKEGLFWAALELAKQWSQPMWNFWQPLYLPLAQAGKDKGRNIIMTGSGGDEWLNVNPLHTADMIRFADIRGLRRLLKSISSSHKTPRFHMIRYLLWRSGLRPILGLQAKRLARKTMPALLQKRMKEKFRNAAPGWVAPDPELQREADSRLDRMVQWYMQKPDPKGRYGFYSNSFAWFFIDTIASMELEQQFEAAQKSGSYIVPPYYDADLLELLLRISPEVQQKGGMEKGLVRLAVARRFPQLNFQRQKKVSAMLYWQSLIRGEGPKAWEKMGKASRLVELGIVDRKKIEEVVQESFISDSAFKNYPVWDILCTEAWIRSRSN